MCHAISQQPLRKVTVDLATNCWWPADAGRSQAVDPESERVTEEQDRTTAAVRDDAGICAPPESLWPKQRRREVERASPEVSLRIPANVNTVPIDRKQSERSDAHRSGCLFDSATITWSPGPGHPDLATTDPYRRVGIKAGRAAGLSSEPHQSASLSTLPILEFRRYGRRMWPPEAMRSDDSSNIHSKPPSGSYFFSLNFAGTADRGSLRETSRA